MPSLHQPFKMLRGAPGTSRPGRTRGADAAMPEQPCLLQRSGSSAKTGAETKAALWQGMVLLQSCRPSIWGCHSPAKPTLLVTVPVTSGKVVSFYTDLGALPLSPE